MAAAPESECDTRNPLLHFEQEKWDQLRVKEIQDFDLLFVGQKVASVFYSTDEFSKCLNLSVAQKEAVLHKEALKCPLQVQASRLLAKWRENLTSSPVTWDKLILCLLSLNESTRKFIVEAIRQHLFPLAGTLTHHTTAVEESRQLSLTSSETAYSGLASSDPVSDDLVPFAIEEKSMPALFQALVVGMTPRDPNRVPYFDREPAKKDLAKKIKVLQRKFARLGILAHSELRNVSLEDLRIFITSISVHEQESIALYSQSMVEMLTMTSVEEVITLCSRIGVWDFFNFQLMVDLAEEFECSTLQQKLTEYGVEIDEFKKNTKLSDFLRVWSGRAPHGSIPDCEPVIVKVDTLWPDFTLHDAAELEGYLASEFKVRQLVFKLSNVPKAVHTLQFEHVPFIDPIRCDHIQLGSSYFEAPLAPTVQKYLHAVNTLHFEHVPFADPINVFRCGSSGIKKTIDRHDIEIEVPPGAISNGKMVTFEYAVALYGPFNFPPNMRPISAVLWLCPQEDVEFQIPLRVKMPHIIRPQSFENYRVFSKATHTEQFDDKHYQFHSLNSEKQHYFSVGQTGYGALDTLHCCFLCITEKVSRRTALDAGYCLSYAVTKTSQKAGDRIDIHIIASFCLETCRTAIKKRFPSEKYEVEECAAVFSFKKVPGILKMTIMEPANSKMFAKYPSTMQISAKQIDFFHPQMNYTKLQYLHKVGKYPPWIRLSAHYRDLTCDDLKFLKLKFKNITNISDIEIFIPTLDSPGQEQGQAQISIEMTTHPVFDEKPTSSELYVIKWQNDQGQTERLWLTGTVANNWHTLGTLFGIPDSMLQVYDKANTQQCCTAVLNHWLSDGSEPRDDYPVTWSGLIEALEDIGGLRNKIESLKQALVKKKRH